MPSEAMILLCFRLLVAAIAGTGTERILVPKNIVFWTPKTTHNRQSNTMIQRVFVVRCSYCRAPLRDPSTGSHTPRYFYEAASIPPVLIEQGWALVNGMELCRSCVQRNAGGQGGHEL